MNPNNHIHSESAEGTRRAPDAARRVPGADSAREREDRGRFSTQRKADAVLRLIRGESLDALSRELGVTAATLSQWQEAFLASGRAGLKSRTTTAQDDEVRRLKAKVGDLTMRLELHEEFIRMRGLEHPLAQRRSSR
jgi:transposase